MCLRCQMQNARTLPHSLVFTYEGLVADPESVFRRIGQFLPGIGPIDTRAEFTIKSIDGFVKRGVTDLNARKIEALSAADRTDITGVLGQAPDVMSFWKYPLLTAV